MTKKHPEKQSGLLCWVLYFRINLATVFSPRLRTYLVFHRLRSLSSSQIYFEGEIKVISNLDISHKIFSPIIRVGMCAGHKLTAYWPSFGEHIRSSDKACMCLLPQDPKCSGLGPHHSLISSALYSHYDSCEIFKLKCVCPWAESLCQFILGVWAAVETKMHVWKMWEKWYWCM